MKGEIKKALFFRILNFKKIVFLTSIILSIMVSFSHLSPARTVRVIEKLLAIDGVTLASAEHRIVLWGIKPVEKGVTPMELNAIDLLDKLIGNEKVSCKIIIRTYQKILARCIGYTNLDLGLELINQGLAVIDRGQMRKDNFSDVYIDAEKLARRNKKGIWGFVGTKKEYSILPENIKKYFSNIKPLFLLIIGPIIGFLIGFILAGIRLKKEITSQKNKIKNIKQKEFILRMQEKNMLMSSIKVELIDNKEKAIAFISLYEEMLKKLNDDNIEPNYKKTGEVIQKHPALDKNIFESNADKFSLLNLNIASDISKIYANMPEQQEYIKLDMEMFIGEAIDTVSNVIKEAEKLLDLVGRAINMIDSESSFLEKSILNEIRDI